MQCEEVIIELDSYLTGELDSEITAEIERHLKQCSACDAERLMLQKENALYRAYRSTIETPAGAWDEIQARMALVPMAEESRSAIHNPRSVIRRLRSSGWWMWAAAASLLLATALTLHFYQWRHAPRSSPTIDTAAENQPHVEQAVKDFEQALAVLEAAYREKKPALDPQLVNELDRNLELTRIAIGQCERALKEDPDNHQAIEFLLLGYEKQIDILRQITEEL